MSKHFLKNVAFRIKQVREFRKLTQQGMADELGIKQKSYAKIENGVTDFSITRLEEIAELLEVEPHELLNLKLPLEELLMASYTRKKNPLPQVKLKTA